MFSLPYSLEIISLSIYAIPTTSILVLSASKSLRGMAISSLKEITERADRARCQSSDKRLTHEPCSSCVILYYVTCDVVTEPILLYINSSDSTKMTAMPAA